jgi:PIN domain nuclease of toxin-antitoxin system
MEAAAGRQAPVIALDTHVLLWWTLEPTRLSARARKTIDKTDRLGISTIVFWEVALLARKGRVRLGTPTSEWTREVLSLARIEPLPLTAEIAVAAEGLTMHPDPADRFIVATALHHQIALVTKDALIVRTGLCPTLW